MQRQPKGISKSLYLCEEEFLKAKTTGFIIERNRGWSVGQTLDIFGGPHDWGMTGTVAELGVVDGRDCCLIEIW